MTNFDRRTLLTAASAGLTAFLAGCQSSGPAPSDPTETTETTSAATTTAEPTETTTARTTADPAELERRTRKFVGLIDEGSYETAHERFGPKVARQLSPEQLKQVWTRLEEQNGAFLSLSNFETGEQGGYDVVTAIANFERGQRTVVLAFGADGITGFRVRQTAANWSPPSYADESAFTERSVSLNAPGDCSLGATLTVPKGVQEAPGVVLVHGQGPSDRDGSIGPNKPYKDLAWGLASRGASVLRYDKRTQVCDVDLAEITIDEAVTDDALTAVERLRETPTVASDDVVVVGHSIGATLAPRIAARDGELAGVVMLAALARSAPRAIRDQNLYIARRDGTVTNAEQQQLDRANRTAEQIRSLDAPDDEVIYLGGDEYWRTLREYDATATAKGLDVPQLFLQGERDYQVTVEDDLARWKRALGDRSNVTFQRYPKLNHLFMPGSGKPGNEEYFQQNNVAEAVVSDVASFTERVTGDGG
ncbi:alpha/beta fold hydrolase [Halorussus aquaticus]|uniref:Alpha/beta fold hydrolase n=1 Tax=Halorussus aquaticus TaxID=2953748 RepID=A0ABD5PZ65_9EURY|nr:alpha/beta fold hydrolase [Halorussus aquaticus]